MGKGKRTDNTMGKGRTDNTMGKGRTDNTMGKGRTDNTMGKEGQTIQWEKEEGQTMQ